jgi:hypothetical protein
VLNRLIRRAFCSAIGLVAAVGIANAQPRLNHWGQVWGTWVWKTNNVLPALVTLHVDGTLSIADGTMFGGVLPNSTTRMTPAHGGWVRTGWQSIAGTSLYLVFDSTTGLISAWGRARTSLQFADNFNSFQGKMFIEILPCAAGPVAAAPVNCPNPLEPAAKWVPQPNLPKDGFDVSGSRLSVVVAEPLP